LRRTDTGADPPWSRGPKMPWGASDCSMPTWNGGPSCDAGQPRGGRSDWPDGVDNSRSLLPLLGRPAAGVWGRFIAVGEVEGYSRTRHSRGTSRSEWAPEIPTHDSWYGLGARAQRPGMTKSGCGAAFTAPRKPSRSRNDGARLCCLRGKMGVIEQAGRQLFEGMPGGRTS